MNIQREAFLGGEKYYCDDCGAIVEENHYPTTEISSSAQAIWDNDREKAVEMGINFSGESRCLCTPIAYARHELVALGATLDGDVATLNGMEYYHDSNDYQSGAGNHDDYKMYRSRALYMNPNTGSVGDYDDWYYENEDGIEVNAVDLGEVVKVIKDKNGEWVEI